MKRIVKQCIAILLAALMMMSAVSAAYAADSSCRANDSGAHSWGSWTTEKKATCTSTGVKVRTCTGCGVRERAQIKKSGHSYGSWKTVTAATCTSEGMRKRTCKVCGHTQKDTTGRKAHSWGEWTVITEPTDWTAGLREHTCGVCGKKEQEEFYPEGTLVRGDRGEDVKTLQEGLNAKGENCGKADGVFGGKTEQAVRAMEGTLGHEEDGIAWPGLLAALIEVEEDDIVDGSAVVLSKTVTNSPQNGVYFTEGEMVAYQITITNYGNEPIVDVEITDPKKGSNEDACVYRTESLEAGASVSGAFNYYVTGDDATAGIIINQAFATWGDGERTESNIVETPAGVIEQPIAAVTAVKKEVNSPKNGSYYTEGEVVKYELTVFNHTGEQMNELMIFDPMKTEDGGLVGFMNPTLDGESLTAYFEYTVTDFDVWQERITNIGEARWVDMNGITHSMNTNSVTVFTGKDGDDDRVRDPGMQYCELTVIKEEISQPQSHDHYHEGEFIEYKITVRNDGTCDFEFPMTVYDILEPGSGNIDSLNQLNVGESYETYYSYQVTEDDVDHKDAIRNIATVMTLVNDELVSAVSNQVVSPIAKHDEDDETEKDSTTSQGSSSACVRTVVTRSDSETVYSVYYCEEHSAMEDAALTLLMTSAEETEANIAEVVNIWNAEAEKMYLELEASVADDVKPLVQKDHDTFMAFAREFRAANSSETFTADYQLAELLMNRVVDICYAMNTAPEGRKDILTAARFIENDEPAECCAMSAYQMASGHADYAELFCDSHADFMSVTNSIMQADTAEQVDALWAVVQQQSYLAAGNEYKAESEAFAAWLEARTKLLDALYPDAHEEAVAVITRTRIDRICAFCANTEPEV